MLAKVGAEVLVASVTGEGRRTCARWQTIGDVAQAVVVTIGRTSVEAACCAMKLGRTPATSNQSNNNKILNQSYQIKTEI